MQHNTQENYSFPDLDLGFSLDHMDDFDLFKPPHPPATHADADVGAVYLYSDSSPASLTAPSASLTAPSASVPLLTPDNSDGSHTDSTLLMGRDPEYVGMSPLHMSPSGLEMPSQHGGIMVDDGFIDEEGFFTPLVSPAMTPSFGSLHAPSSNMMTHDMFSPLASPALHPQSLHHISRHHSVSTATAFSPLHSPIIIGNSIDQQIVAHLQQKLANIQQQEQQSQQRSTQSSSSTSSPIFPSSSSQGETSESARASKTLRKTKQSPLVKPTSSPYEQSQQRRARKKRATLQQSMALSPQTQGNVLVMIPPQLSASMSMPPPMQPLTTGQHILVSPAPKTQPSQQQQSMNNTTISAISSPTIKPQIIAPATPASLMKLGGGGPLISLSNTTPPSSIVSLPAGMLPAPMLSLPSSPSSNYPSPIFMSPSIHPTARQMLSPVPKPLLSPRSAPTGPGDTALVVSSPKALKSGVPASPRALKPLISPSLKPLLPGMVPLPADAAASILANKSNYQNLLEGKAQSLGITFSPAIHTGIEIRRTAHKAAEQKRRDSLKQSFENLRKEVLEALISLPAPTPSAADAAAKEESTQDDGTTVMCGVDDTNFLGKNHEADGKEDKGPEALNREREKQVKQMSKVALLKHSYEYILRLKHEWIRKDERIAKLEGEVRELRKQCGLPEVTEEEEREMIRIREEEEMMALVKREEVGDEVGDEEDEEDEEDEDAEMGV